MKLHHLLLAVVAVTQILTAFGDEATARLLPDDLEPGDVSEPITEEGSGEADDTGTTSVPGTTEPSLEDKMRWVTYSRSHKQIHEASTSEAGSVINKYGLRNSKRKSVDCESGSNQKSPVGIIHQLVHRTSSNEEPAAAANSASDETEREGEEEFTETSIHAADDPPQRSKVAQSSAFNAMDTSRYPGFATGMLKSRNCTAFMIGRISALTLAECVYDWKNKQWTKDLDLWRGRNCDTYINLMKWETVTIPHLYYHRGDEDYNWAYIQFNDDTHSDNWIGLNYDCQLTHKADVHVTLSGYQEEYVDAGCPYQCRCILLGKKSQTYCPSNFPFALRGSPLVAATSIPMEDNPDYIGTSPRLYGIASGAVQASINKVTMITEEMFWLVYHLMGYFKDKPNCDATRQEWLIKRVVQSEY